MFCALFNACDFFNLQKARYTQHEKHNKKISDDFFSLLHADKKEKPEKILQ